MSHSSTELDKDIIRRIRRAKAQRLLSRGITAGAAAMVGVHGLAACNADDGTEPESGDDATSPNVPVPGGVEEGKADWAQYEGERNTDMVVYEGDSWTEQSQCNTRGGCVELIVTLKVVVTPVAGANVDAKRVGVVYRSIAWDEGETETALGTYFTTRDDGKEEWHVPVHIHGWGGFLPVFNAWYQDGSGKTYYDDNQGEFHVAQGRTNAVRQINEPWSGATTDVELNSGGVTGVVSAMVADIDYDKNVELVWTTDNWETVNTYGIGDTENGWRWVQDSYGGMDIFSIPLNIPGSYDTFEYAIVYTHGVVHNATPYEFWDNNYGRNFVITQRDVMDPTDY